jgi:hypothetical protein
MMRERSKAAASRWSPTTWSTWSKKKFSGVIDSASDFRLS